MNVRTAVAILLATLWVNASEFVRNEVLLKSYWLDHYRSLGLEFPSSSLNGMVWALWGFSLAIAIWMLSRRFGLLQTVLISWFMAFVLMWIVAWNLGVLPGVILVYAIPLSLLETSVAAWICGRVAGGGNSA